MAQDTFFVYLCSFSYQGVLFINLPMKYIFERTEAIHVTFTRHSQLREDNPPASSLQLYNKLITKPE